MYLKLLFNLINLFSLFVKANVENPVTPEVAVPPPQRMATRPPMSLPPMNLPPPDEEEEDAFYLPTPSSRDPVTGEYDSTAGPRRRLVKDPEEYFAKHQPSTSASNVYRYLR